MKQRPCLRLLAMRLLAMSLAALGLASSSQAQIRTDGSTNGRPVQLQGPDYRIDPALGRLSGSNLFHSFDTFQLGRGESATFSTQSLQVNHVISRVTGGAASNIQGLLRLDAGNTRPGFWFINPAGVVFGDGARIEVPGAFHASTAAQLRFSDGTRWDARSSASSFVSAAPEAFGFLGASAPLRVERGANLSGALHQAISLSSGDLSVQGATLLSSGGLALSAVGNRTVDVPASGSLPSSLTGNLSLGDGALVVLRTEGAVTPAPLAVSAGSMGFSEGAQMVSLTRQSSTALGGAIDLQVSDLLSLQDGSVLQTLASTSARGGDIRVQARNLLLDGGAYLSTNSEGSGRGGDIRLQIAGILLANNDSGLYSVATGSGGGGLLSVQAQTLLLQGGAYLWSEGFADGAPGAIEAEARGDFSLSQAAFVQSLNGSSQAAGAVRLRAGETLSLGIGAKLTSASNGDGNGAELQLQGRNLLLNGAASLTSGANAGGQAGGMLLQAQELLQLDGRSELGSLNQGGSRAGSLQLQAATLRLQGGSRLYSTSFGSGRQGADLLLQASGSLQMQGAAALVSVGNQGGSSGLVQLRGQEILVTGASQLLSTSEDGNGAIGRIDLAAGGRLLLSGDSSISANTTSDTNAGAIRLEAQDLRVDGGASVTSSALDGRGNAASVDLIARGELVVTGAASIFSATRTLGRAGTVRLSGQNVAVGGASLVFTNSGSQDGSPTGDAGDLLVQAVRELRIDGGASLDASSLRGGGRAGSVLFSSGQLLEVNDGIVGSQTRGGAGGRVELRTPGTLRLIGSRLSASTLGASAAGNVLLQGGEVELRNSTVFSLAAVGSQGNAGRIDIVAAQGLLLREGSSVSSSTLGSGAAGDVLLQATRLQMQGASRVSALAAEGSSGQTGNVSLLTSSLLSLEGGSVASIDNLARVANPSLLRPTLLRLQGADVLLNRSLVTASATGNADASRIDIQADKQLALTDAIVSTAAQDGNGGSLRARGGQQIKLVRSALTTSVFGQQGNGGDILVQTDPNGLLLMDGGFIQANTAARNARGGLVRIEVGALVASENRVVVGGDQPLRFDPQRFPRLNVIQAAAPDGVSGFVRVTGSVDVAGSLALLDRRLLDPGRLGRSPCERPGGSALALGGRGGLPPQALAMLGAPGQGPKGPKGPLGTTVACR